ncbi:MAG TPA: hypothetical protein VEA41_17805 [Salinarimonas sp.]|nr:hypothetical protein [Salinarimonas sp.]
MPGESGNPFALRGRTFSSPNMLAFGLLLLAAAACVIALAGLALLAGDGRTTERVTAGPQLVAALQAPPRGWADPPTLPPAPAPALVEAPVAPPAEPAPAPSLAQVAPAIEGDGAEEDRPGEPVDGIPLPPRRDIAEGTPFAGVWAPDAAACSPRQNRRGYLPAVINSEGAWAGETSCVFGSGQQVGSTWRFPAVCSNARRKWKADVRLTVTGDRLVWASQRGTQAYVRCARTSRDT